MSIVALKSYLHSKFLFLALHLLQMENVKICNLEGQFKLMLWLLLTS